MDERNYVLEMRCDEARGPVVRHVSFVELSYEKLVYLYGKLRKFDVLFNDEVPNNFISFAGRFLRQGLDRNVVASGLIWEVDDIGIFFITDITVYSARIHFTFWDRQLKGREPLIKAMIKLGMERYGFERLEILVGLYARAALYAVERIGFVKEGRLRKVMRYKGEWYDANIYSVIREEVESWGVTKDKQFPTVQPISFKKSLASSEVQEESHKIS